MRIPQIFNSPILIKNISEIAQNIENHGSIINHFQNAIYALSYNLEQALPHGGFVQAYNPKGILEQLLPEAAKNKKCKIICINGTPKLTSALLAANLLDQNANPADADLTLIEPDGLTSGGALVSPSETLPQGKIIGIGSIFQWTTERPATHDFIFLSKVITELGIHTPENLELNVSSLKEVSSLSAPL